MKDFNKSVFLAKKAAKEKSKNQPKQLPVKEVKFKAGNDVLDLQKKVDYARKYLENCHSCHITVMSGFERSIHNNQIMG